MPGLMTPDPILARGGGLEETALGSVKRANQGLEAAAYSQSERAQYNERVVASNMGANRELGSAIGSAAGKAAFGPVGGAIGGTAAGLIGGLFK